MVEYEIPKDNRDAVDNRQGSVIRKLRNVVRRKFSTGSKGGEK